MQLEFPFQLDGRGRSATISEAAHINQLIEQVLFTMPGERVNRPEFGSGIHQLLFAPNSDELAKATDYLVRGALQQWLGDRILVEDVQIAIDDNKLSVTVVYQIHRTQERQVAHLQQEVPA